MQTGGVFMHLTQKERMLLEDQKKHEEMCIKKYTDAAERAQDPELKQVFLKYADQERQHLNTINQILSGQVPNTQQGQQQSQQQGQQQNQQQNMQQGQMQNMQMRPQQNMQQRMGAGQNDADLCNDLLMTEKYVSGAYNATIFECTGSNVRQALNHIQKEEQQHGEGLFNYMQKNGMYNPS
jgi:rubrerythrin